MNVAKNINDDIILPSYLLIILWFTAYCSVRHTGLLVAMQKSQVMYFAAYSAHIPPPFSPSALTLIPLFWQRSPSCCQAGQLPHFPLCFFAEFLRKAIDKFSRIATGKEYLKVPKCEIFHLFDFNDFYGIKSL